MTENNDIIDLQKHADELYQQTNLTEHQRQNLFSIWKQLSPEALVNFIRKNEALLFTRLANTEQVSLEDAMVPWSIQDMNAYYVLHPADQKTRAALGARCRQLISQNPVTSYDDLQLSQGKNILEAESKDDLNVWFNQLELLSYAHALLKPEKTAEQYRFKYLFALLSIYRTQLNASYELEKKKKADEPIEYQKDIIVKIDWINRHFAEYFNHMISTQQINGHAPELKELLLQLGELTEEIYPWLSVIFREELFNSSKDDNEINHDMEFFISFHSLLQEKSLGEQLYNINGMSQAPLIKQFLQKERLTWNGINASDLDKKITNIKYYLHQSELSPRIALLICKDIVPIAKTFLGLRPDVAFIIYLLIERIKRDSHVLKDASRYISSLESYEHCPGLEVGMLQENKSNQAITVALQAGFLPPSAQLLYGMWKINPDRTKEIINDLATKAPDILHETLLIIFSDDKYAEQHEHWLGLGIHPLIDDKHYPLFALKRAYAAESQANDERRFELWMQFIDSGMMINTPFLATDANQQLFAKLQPYIGRIVQTKSLTHNQIKSLGIALALYRATQLKLSALEDPSESPLAPLLGVRNFAFLMGPPRIEYAPESTWAEEYLWKLMVRIAYPSGSAAHIDFDGITRFLDLEFKPASTPSISLEAQEDQVAKDINVLVTTNLHINFEHQFKLFHVFARLFLRNQKIDVRNLPEVSEEFIKNLPPIGYALLGITEYPMYVDVPEWFSVSLREKILTVIQATYLNQGLMKASVAPYMAQFQNLLNEADESEKAELQAMIPASWVFEMPEAKQQEKKVKFYFVKQIYLAYCKQHNLGNLNGVIQQEAQRDDLFKEVQPIRDRMSYIGRELTAHHKTVKKNHSGWRSSLSFALGYNLKESKAQLDHFKTIESYIAQHDILNLQDCDSLLKQLTETITAGTFKKHFWSTRFYHENLQNLVEELLLLRDKICRYSPEEDKDNAILAKSSCNQESKQSSVTASPFTLYSNQTSKHPKTEVAEEKMSHRMS